LGKVWLRRLAPLMFQSVAEIVQVKKDSRVCCMILTSGTGMLSRQSRRYRCGCHHDLAFWLTWHRMSFRKRWCGAGNPRGGRAPSAGSVLCWHAIAAKQGLSRVTKAGGGAGIIGRKAGSQGQNRAFRVGDPQLRLSVVSSRQDQAYRGCCLGGGRCLRGEGGGVYGQRPVLALGSQGA